MCYVNALSLNHFERAVCSYVAIHLEIYMCAVVEVGYTVYVVYLAVALILWFGKSRQDRQIKYTPFRL